MDELQAVLAFSQLKGSSTKKFLDLYQFYGSALEAYKKIKPQPELERFSENELLTAKANSISLIPITSADYPASLKILSDAPLVLYVKGKLPDSHLPKIAIVGTRSATSWGKDCTHHFAKILASYGIFVVSGLARGIDTAAHSGAIEKSVAFIGSGLLHLYPKENEKLAETIAEKGAIVSEFLLNAPPTRYSFPKRNRLIAAFSDALLLTEAPKKSGAMITMRIGSTLKKALFCLPGRALNEPYAGNHQLIKEGNARLVESPQELAKFLDIASKPPQITLGQKPIIFDEEKKILDFLGQSDLSIDELFCFTRLPISHLQALLTKLVIKNLAVELPGKRYKRTRDAWQNH